LKKFLLLAFVLFVIFALPLAATSSIRIPAVDSNGNGLLTYAELTVVDGNGGIYVDVEPFISVETQNSAKTAARVAQQLTGYDLRMKDLLFKVIANTESVDGPSGGNALSLLAYAEFTGKKLREDLSATGTIELDGSIGKIGGVVQKAKAAHDAGITLFLVPVGQSVSGGVDLAKFWEPRGMQVVEVRNLTESVQFAFTAKGQHVNAVEHVELPLRLRQFPATLQTIPTKQMALDEANDLQGILPTIQNDVMRKELEKAINDTLYLAEKGYYYSAANTIFIARISYDSFLYQNFTAEDVAAKADELQQKISKIAPVTKTKENLEWAAGAELRVYWAMDKLRKLKEKPSTGEGAGDDLASAQGWLNAAEKMNLQAQKIGGTAFNEADAKAAALQLLNESNRSIQAIPGDSEAENHFRTASALFNDGKYAASAMDASFALAFTRYYKEIEGKLGDEVAAMILQDPPVDYQNTLWPQLYFAHSIYNLEEAKRQSDFSFLANTLRLQLLAQYFNRSLALLRNESVAPLVIPSAQPAAILPPLESNPTSPMPVIVTASDDKSTLLIGIVALFAVIAIAVIALRPSPSSKGLTPKEKAGRIDDLLLEKRISEKTYLELRKKYSGKK